MNDKKVQEIARSRRQRQKEALAAAILKSARGIAIKEGWPAVSIRKIAAEIQYTAPVIYELFKNKEAILIEIESQGFRQLRFHLEEIAHKEADPRKQLVQLAEEHWDWAFKNAEVYQVMFNFQGIHSTPPNQHAIRDCSPMVVQCLQQIQLFQADQDSLFFHWWALVHGSISLVMSGQMAGRQEQMKRHMIQAVQHFVKSL